jgi:hypothetical protein
MGRRYRSPGPTPAVRPAFSGAALRRGGKPQAFAATLAATMPSKTIRLVEIADILGVTHLRTFVIVRQSGFPAPVGREGQSRVWDRREVVTWARKGRKEKPWR